MLTNQDLFLNRIRMDGTQCRVRTVLQFIATYASMYANGEYLPPPVIFVDKDGNHWIGDGWHRILAALRNNMKKLKCQIRPGTRDDAVMYNIKANRDHSGIPMSKDDREHSIKILLTKCKKTKNWTDTAIANMVGVSRVYVALVRKQLEDNGVKFSDKRVDPETGKTYDTANGHRGAKSREQNRNERLRRGEYDIYICTHCQGKGYVKKLRKNRA